MKKDDVQIHVVITSKGVEKVQIFGGIENQSEGMKLYDFISKRIQSLDKALKRIKRQTTN